MSRINVYKIAKTTISYILIIILLNIIQMSVVPMTYWSISSIELTKEAKKLGFKVNIVDKSANLFYIEGNGKNILFKSTDFGGNSGLGVKISDDKGLTYKLLENHGFPIAKSIYVDKSDFNTLEESHISHLKFPLVVKPLEEGHGNGVLMNIISYEDLLDKLKVSFEEYNSMIVQEQIEGEEVRLLFVKGELVIAINRIPASVIGDGKNNLQKLIDIENDSNPLRGEGYETALSYIEVDNELRSYLDANGDSLLYKPKENETVQLRGNSNIGTGGHMEDVTDIVHPTTIELCKEVLETIGLDISGVDIMTTDISKPLSETGGIILEVNGTPGIGGHREVLGRNTAKEILTKVFEI